MLEVLGCVTSGGASCVLVGTASGELLELRALPALGWVLLCSCDLQFTWGLAVIYICNLSYNIREGTKFMYLHFTKNSSAKFTHSKNNNAGRIVHF